MIRRVVEHLQVMSRANAPSARRAARTAFDLFAHLNVILALGAAGVYYASCVLQGYQLRAQGVALAFLYFLSMYLWNSLASLEMTQHLGINRYRFYSRHRAMLFAVSGASIIALLAIAFTESRSLFYLMLFATVAGSAYHVSIVPRVLRPILRYSNLRDIPTSRDLFVALAWGILLTFIPQATAEKLALTPTSILTFLWVSTLAYLRSLVFDLRDIEGDRIMGRETLVTVVGERRARRALVAGTRVILVVMAAYALLDSIGSRQFTRLSAIVLLQLPVLLYSSVLIKRRPGTIKTPQPNTALIDLQFLLSGLLAWVAEMLPWP
jgi:4-hydroxy-3-methylbut-2-enyl diphosphate reductase